MYYKMDYDNPLAAQGYEDIFAVMAYIASKMRPEMHMERVKTNSKSGAYIEKLDAYECVAARCIISAATGISDYGVRAALKTLQDIDIINCIQTVRGKCNKYSMADFISASAMTVQMSTSPELFRHPLALVAYYHARKNNPPAGKDRNRAVMSLQEMATAMDCVPDIVMHALAELQEIGEAKVTMDGNNLVIITNEVVPGIVEDINMDIVKETWNAVAVDNDMRPVFDIAPDSNRAKQTKSLISRYGLEQVLSVIKNDIPAQPFLTGNNSEGWIIGYDWFTKYDNFIRVAEGGFAEKVLIDNNNFEARLKAMQEEEARQREEEIEEDDNYDYDAD